MSIELFVVAFACSVTEFSASTPHLAYIVATCCGALPEFGKDVITCWATQFTGALTSGTGIVARLLLRFLGELVGASVVSTKVRFL